MSRHHDRRLHREMLAFDPAGRLSHVEADHILVHSHLLLVAREERGQVAHEGGLLDGVEGGAGGRA